MWSELHLPFPAGEALVRVAPGFPLELASAREEPLVLDGQALMTDGNQDATWPSRFFNVLVEGRRVPEVRLVQAWTPTDAPTLEVANGEWLKVVILTAEADLEPSRFLRLLPRL